MDDSISFRTRQQAAEFLTARGRPITFQTLTRLHSEGKGPRVHSWWGPRPHIEMTI